jgi:long-chain acyl-CoA synthetase
VQRVKRRFVEAELADTGMERAKFWGFPNTYTYTKAIGEQIVAGSGLPFSIVRPAVVESTLAFPFPGWNEGINTSAPLIYILRQGGLQIPGSDNYLDFVPCDLVAGSLTLALAELLDGTQKPVYQAGTSDSNPCTMRRFFELSGLYKRKYYQRTGKGGAVVSFLQSHFEGAMLSSRKFERFGPHVLARGASAASRWLGDSALGPMKSLLAPAAGLAQSFAEQQRRVGNVLQVFVPFTAEYDYVFRCDATRAAFSRLGEADRARIGWYPERIDWRRWFLEVHVPGLEKWVFPSIEERVQRRVRAPQRHETLPALLEEMAERFDLAVALQRTERDGLSRITFRDWQELALATAARLSAHGVAPGDRVLLAGANHPAWPVAFFGILFAGATVVPVDVAVRPEIAENLQRASGARCFIADGPVAERLRSAVPEDIVWLDLHAQLEPGPKATPHPVEPDALAALFYTSGTTGTPKGVMLSHANLTALVASLAPLFPLGKNDRVLSVLPLHHTFELTCGMLLPLSRGARIVYLDDLSAERLEHGLKAGRITGIVAVPALWESLERRILSRVAERGPVAVRLFDVALELNRVLGKTFGVDAGKLLFGTVHRGLGGHLRYIVSGGAALSERTHQVFAGLGLHLSEGYGLTEASPVLSVAEGRPGARAGNVGRAVPGVELRIADPNSEGIGEVVARGPNVMLGYVDDEDATRRVIDEDGWLHTGDLGKLDGKGRLVIVGRAKDTIVTATGENVYPDDVEARLGHVEHLSELCVLGARSPDGRERIACVGVVAPDAGLDDAARHERARAALERACSELPPSQRPGVSLLVDAPLPCTATRKVKRPELARLVEERCFAPAESAADVSADGAERAVRAAIAAIARRRPAELGSAISLRGDLGFDSLMLLELLVALEARFGGPLDAERLGRAATVGDVEALVRDGSARSRAEPAAIEREEAQALELPPVLRDAAMHWLGRAQLGFYDRVLKTKVFGRAFIPYNRVCIVVANHASHLDMGLVKYALGPYGKNLVCLAAQDYFFEGNRWRKAYFENFTNLVPIERNGALREALSAAEEILSQGKVLLIFPEGTRSTDGSIREFRASVGRLALKARADILPVYLGGTYAALPKGATVLRRRDVEARIGPPISFERLSRLVDRADALSADRIVAEVARRAVVALSRSEVLVPETLEPDQFAVPQTARPDASLAPVFHELKGRFVAGSVEQPVSYYFSLGERERWTVRITPSSCEVAPGKVVSPADCVLKTSPDMFTRIVREAYTPSPAEFMSGRVKSNNIALLLTFQKAFQLSQRGEA